MISIQKAALAIAACATFTLSQITVANPTAAIPTRDFLDSIGVNCTFPNRGQPLDKSIEMIRYTGVRWVRCGIEGISDNGPTTVQTFLDMHAQTGVKFSWGLGSGGVNVAKSIATAKPIAAAGALIAFEGNNEPNNWGIDYQGEKGGGKAPSWLAVAKLHRDLYAAVKGDSDLSKYPVWSLSENGAQRDNAGLQFLKIPQGANTLMPDGTQYADAANVHNYIYHPNSPKLADNKTWHAADPSPACRVDGLAGNYGRTWLKKFPGYSPRELEKLPRVTTETGVTIDETTNEDVQAINILSLYLDQFKRGYSHTALYILRDRTDESGNQQWGMFRPDYSARKSADYLHNLTTILADTEAIATPGTIDYSITDQPATVHDLLLRRSDGTFQLIIWNERLTGSDQVAVRLGQKWPSVAIFDPTTGVQAVSETKDIDSITLTLSDHPLILNLASPAAK